MTTTRRTRTRTRTRRRRVSLGSSVAQVEPALLSLSVHNCFDFLSQLARYLRLTIAPTAQVSYSSSQLRPLHRSHIPQVRALTHVANILIMHPGQGTANSILTYYSPDHPCLLSLPWSLPCTSRLAHFPQSEDQQRTVWCLWTPSCFDPPTFWYLPTAPSGPLACRPRKVVRCAFVPATRAPRHLHQQRHTH